MIIKPALDIKNYPVFEITGIDIPESIDEQIMNGEWVSVNHNVPAGSLYFLSGRCKIEGVSEELRKLTLEVNIKLTEYIRTQTHYDINSEFPRYYLEKKDLTQFAVEYVRDDPGHQLDVHLDNRLLFGTMIMNLADNDQCHTSYHITKDSKEPIYVGPSAKGTAVFHINTHTTYHGSVNTSTKYRYVAISQYVVCPI